MVLDPLTAFSVACNVLQVVEFGVKALSKAADYRKADTGLLTEQKNLQDVFQALSNLNTDLQATLPSQNAALQASVEATHLLQANKQCLKLSKEFVIFLERLKVKDKGAVFESLRMSIKTLWHKDTMVAMERSISQARDNLNIAFLVYMNSTQATQETQNAILKATDHVESSILKALTDTSNSMQDEIKALAKQLDNVNLDTDQAVAQFTTSHRDLLAQLSNQVDSILSLHTNFQTLADEKQVLSAREKILHSLHFPQIRERRDHVKTAFQDTYRWILESSHGQYHQWNDFGVWLGAVEPSSRIYWIHGKIGAGKSTIMRFLEENIDLQQHMLPWADEHSIVRAQCFFWNSGNPLQKSMTGFLRSLLAQLLEQTPSLIPKVVSSKRWRMARLAEDLSVDWTDRELQEAVQEYFSCIGGSVKIFLLVDGLDEIEGTDDRREEISEYLKTLTKYDHLKICLSSRPWNVFQDAFGDCPQLKLEDLTYKDIRAYVIGELQSNRQFQQLQRFEKRGCDSLIEGIVRKAGGVFLWVRLVVRDIISGLRDGDGIRALEKKVQLIPAELDDYFQRLMDSLEPRLRQQASAMFQIMLHDEEHFVTLHSQRLIDLLFIEEGSPTFALDQSYDFSDLDFENVEKLQFQIDSASRKLNSCCKGLLECFYNEEDVALNWLADDLDLEMARQLRYTVGFLHRSLYDFLLRPKMQKFLHSYTDGPFDARLYLCNVRLVQLKALTRLRHVESISVGLASYIMSALSVPELRDSPYSTAVARLMQPLIEDIARQPSMKSVTGWYISTTLRNWHAEGSTFMTMAIDFGLNHYVLADLKRQGVQEKSGRPILDHILRPRFIGDTVSMSSGREQPNLAILNKALQYGANPNQPYKNSTVWTRFLCHLAGKISRGDAPSTGETIYKTIEALLSFGAATTLPESWLATSGFFYAQNREDGQEEDNDMRFLRRWSRTRPTTELSDAHGRLYLVSDLIERFRPIIGSGVDRLKDMIVQRQNQISQAQNQRAASDIQGESHAIPTIQLQRTIQVPESDWN